MPSMKKKTPNSQRIKLDLGKLKYLFGNKYVKMFNLRKLKLDAEAVYSVTPAVYAKKIINIINENIDSNDITITDACSCVGADTISFAKNFKKVNAIEMDEIRYNYLKHNLTVANVKNCNINKGDCLKVMKTLKQDVIFIDAPWEGKSYKFKKEMNLYLSGKPLSDVVNSFGNNATLIVLKVPNNFVFNELKKRAHFKTYRKYDLKKFQIIVLKDFQKPKTPKPKTPKPKTPKPKKKALRKPRKPRKTIKLLDKSTKKVICDKWNNNKTNVKNGKVNNPLTNRMIKKDSQIYKEIERDCNKKIKVSLSKMNKKQLINYAQKNGIKTTIEKNNKTKSLTMKEIIKLIKSKK